MKAYFEQRSPILEPGRLDEALSRAMEKSLDEYAEEVRDWQENGEHTGVVRNVKINGAVISHQASRIGESPSPLSNSLVDSLMKNIFCSNKECGKFLCHTDGRRIFAEDLSVSSNKLTNEKKRENPLYCVHCRRITRLYRRKKKKKLF